MENNNELPAPPASIGIAGDWHGNTAWMKHALHRLHGAGIDTVLHVGDLRILWPPAMDGPLSDEDSEMIPGAEWHDTFTVGLADTLEQLSMQMLFIDGNHDNHPRLRALPRDSDGFGIVSNRLKYIPRGHRFTLGGVRFAGLGGAFSINKQRLTIGEDWWPEEVVTADDVAALGHEPVDVLLTHDVPAGVDLQTMFDLPEAIEREAYVSRLLLRDAVRNTDPALVFSGHWHQRRTQQLPFTRTEVHVLHMDGGEGNTVALDTATLGVSDVEIPPRFPKRP
ncbi:metallophosphoesterase [Arthrobacter sp. zg-Y1110]|uniref:metallophosphoesterase family protein n=1 Tax=Arthrobacter sp. zg-Y1110 TaxID=2886932 RepID=UPI001D146FA4|nr:metallophosphoesterase [Arthrobacter sp. zg-Y1110]MCC3293001.1 metallophosphoesterase [Arthrobacter sp. zg-Y1110]UWX86940.1 metallophosphoesterase [Arthrobacter sp. zg-Y1110]